MIPTAKVMAVLLALSCVGLIMLSVGLPPYSLPAFTYIMGSVAIGPGLSLAVYVLWSESRRMAFKVEAGYLSICLGRLGRVLIPLSQIKSVMRVDKVKLLARLGGVSLPGLHQGLFSVEGLGRVRLLSTRLHDLVLVELYGGLKYVFSPNDPQRLVEAVQGSRGGSPSGEGVKVYRIDVKVVALVIMLLALFFALTLNLYMLLPQKVPTHYGWSWTPDKWGSKEEFIVVPLAVLLPVHFALSILFYSFSKYTPGISLLLLPLTTGLGCILLSLTLMPLYLPAAG